VVDGDLEIDHGVAGQVSIGGSVHNALFHSRNEILGDRTSKNFIGELEIAATRERFHLDPAIAELAMTAGLLLVASLNVGPAANGFAIGDLRRFEGDVHAVAFFQAADDNFHVLLSAAGEKELAGL